jgi:uncharacterized small protein (DUF1192 family)
LSEHGGTAPEVANLTAEVERLQAELAEAKASHQIELDGVKAELESVKASRTADVFIAKTNAALDVTLLALRKIPIADAEVRAMVGGYVTQEALEGKEWMKQA